MTIQLQFDSNGETITAEVDERGGGELVILDEKLEWNDMLEAMGGQKTPLGLLNYLWNDPDVAAKTLDICLHRDEFTIGKGRGRQWYKLNDPDVRLVLSFHLPICDRIVVASSGDGYSIDQRLVMLTGMARMNVAIFLAQYTGSDLLPYARRELEDTLDQDGIKHLIEHGDARIYLPGDRFDLIMRMNDAYKAYALGVYKWITKNQENALLASIESEPDLAAALMYSNLLPTEIMEHARRLKDPEMRLYASRIIGSLSRAQREQLISEDERRQIFRRAR